MTDQLVTVIVPVYNAERYLEQGVDSLLSQTHKNIEIILVDDFSTDSSWSICQKYSREYKDRVRVFKNKRNYGGPLRGRELGVKMASGQWITFMDCDDYVEPNYVKNLLETTRNGKYDIAVTGHQRLFDDGRKEKFRWNDYFQTTRKRLAEFYNHFLTNNFWTDPSDTVGQNLIRASVAKKTSLAKYPDKVWAEDTLMALAFLSNSRNGVNFVDRHDFNWRQRAGSGSKGGFSSTADKDGFFKACYDIFHRDDIYDTISSELPLVSVVVPIYNVENFLSECLDSILSQSYKNIEVICVNDGSLDGSESIVDEYMRKDSRVIKLNKKNQGLNRARESGVDISRGDYIMFVDSDDKITQNCIRDLYELIMKTHSDISVGGYKTFISSTDKDDSTVSGEVVVAESDHEAIKWLLSGDLKGKIVGGKDVLRMTAWAKLYKKNIVKETDWNFANYQTNEDEFEVMQWYNAAKNGVAVSPDQVYYYRLNPGSKTRAGYSNKNPQDRIIDRFEFAYSWYTEIKRYLNNDYYNGYIGQRFIWMLSDGVSRSIEENVLDKEMGSAITAAQNFCLDRRVNSQAYLDKYSDLLKSRSWRMTTPIRKITSLKLVRRFGFFMIKLLRLIRHPQIVTRRLIKESKYLLGRVKYKEAWVITDRYDQAADNGIIFYDYMVKNHRNVRCYYVISKESPDFKKLESRGVNVIDHNSEDHKILMKYADVEISAIFNFSPFDSESLGRNIPVKKAFILHGMDQSDLSLHYSRLELDLYCVVTKTSYEFYKNGESLVDIRDKNLQLTGMPRYDLIRQKLSANEDQVRKNIVIAPTWRRFLLYKPGTVERQPEEYFIKSKYFRNYRDLFDSPELKRLSKAYNVILIPHPEMIMRMEEFNLPSYIDVTTYQDLGTDGLYDLALTTKLFISDFSSTIFDFAFLGSNVVHFNFDTEDYYSDKQELYKSWFDIERDGLGPSFSKVESLKEYLKDDNWVRYEDNIKSIWRQIPVNSSELIYKHIGDILRSRDL